MDRNRAKLNSLKAFEDGKSKSHTLGYVDKLKEVTHLSQAKRDAIDSKLFEPSDLVGTIPPLVSFLY